MTNRAMLVFLASFALAACSGGGGGTVSAPAPVPAPPAPPVTVNAPINFQAVSTTVTYPAASVTAAMDGLGGVATMPSGATVMVATDSNGNLKALSFNMPPFTGAVPVISPIWTGSADAVAIADTFSDNYGSANSIGYILSEAAGGQLLASSAYGAWLYSDSGKAPYLAAFAFGNLTPAAAVPVTGSATFNGYAIGASTNSDHGSVSAVQGNAQIIANFSAQTVVTNLTNLAVRGESYGRSPLLTALPDFTGTSAITGNAYAGPISGGGFSGTINGNFYGSAAQETAGVWQVTSGVRTWLGSFGAK